MPSTFEEFRGQLFMLVQCVWCTVFKRHVMAGRFPNCCYELETGHGLGSKFLKLVTRTPNGVGIAPGKPILFNAGPGYTGILPTNVQDASERNTRFRGRLDQLFESDGSAQAQLSVQHPGPEKQIPNTPLKRNDPPQTSPESSEKNPKPTEGPSQTKTGGSVAQAQEACETAAGGSTGATGTMTGANGTKTGVNVTKTGPNGGNTDGQHTSPDNQGKDPAKAKSDLGTKLTTGTSPFMYSVWLTPENTLHIRNDDNANKKLPKDR